MQLVHPDDRDEWKGECMQRFMDVKSYSTLFRIQVKDSTVRYIQAAGSVERDHNNNVLMTGINRDIFAIPCRRGICAKPSG